MLLHQDQKKQVHTQRDDVNISVFLHSHSPLPDGLSLSPNEFRLSPLILSQPYRREMLIAWKSNRNSNLSIGKDIIHFGIQKPCFAVLWDECIDTKREHVRSSLAYSPLRALDGRTVWAVWHKSIRWHRSVKRYAFFYSSSVDSLSLSLLLYFHHFNRNSRIESPTVERINWKLKRFPGIGRARCHVMMSCSESRNSHFFFQRKHKYYSMLMQIEELCAVKKKSSTSFSLEPNWWPFNRLREHNRQENRKKKIEKKYCNVREVKPPLLLLLIIALSLSLLPHKKKENCISKSLFVGLGERFSFTIRPAWNERATCHRAQIGGRGSQLWCFFIQNSLADGIGCRSSGWLPLKAGWVAPFTISAEKNEFAYNNRLRSTFLDNRQEDIASSFPLFNTPPPILVLRWGAMMCRFDVPSVIWPSINNYDIFSFYFSALPRSRYFLCQWPPGSAPYAFFIIPFLPLSMLESYFSSSLCCPLPKFLLLRLSIHFRNKGRASAFDG